MKVIYLKSSHQVHPFVPIFMAEYSPNFGKGEHQHRGKIMRGLQRDDGEGPMEAAQLTSIHAVRFLIGIAFVYCVTRHSRGSKERTARYNGKVGLSNKVQYNLRGIPRVLEMHLMSVLPI